MVESLRAILDLGGDWLKDNVRNLFSILRSPRDFMLSRELDANPPLLEASAFAAFVSLLNLVIYLPVFRTLGIEAETPAYVIVDTVLTYGFWFLYGSMFHAAATMFRGRRSYQATVVCFLYMTAFSPLLLMLSIPGETVIRRMLLERMSPPDLEFYLQLVPTLAVSTFGLITLVISAVGYGYVFFAMATALRTVHVVGQIRGFLITTAGCIGWITVGALVEVPALQLFWQAFKRAAG